MNTQCPSDDRLRQTVEERDQHDGNDPSADQHVKKTPDIKPNQIARDDPQKAQKLTQAGRPFDVDEAEE